MKAWKTWLGAAPTSTTSLVLVILVGGAFASERPKGPDHFAITGARIVTGTGEVIEDGTIVIADGLIVAIGHSPGAQVAQVGQPGTIDVPAGSWVIDGTGKTVYPGLVDALSDLGLVGSDDERQKDTRPSFASGPEDRPFTTSWLSAADELDLADERIEKWRSGGFTSTLTSPSKGIVSGQAAFINLAAERERELVVSAPAALRLNLTSSGSRRSYPGSLMGVIAYIKQLFEDATYYRESWTVYERSPKGRHRPSYDRALGPISKAQVEAWPVLLPGHLEHEIERAVRIAGEIGVRPVVYGLHGGYAAADFLAVENVPVLVSVKWPKRDKDADPDAEESLQVLRLRDRAPGTPAALAQAGVDFAFYSDGLEAPDDVLAGVRLAVEAGLSRESALEALTITPASIFGLEDRLGSLTEGKIANVIVASGDLFDESTRVETVFVDGSKYEIRPAKKKTAEGGEE